MMLALKYFSQLWSPALSAVADHLWQSTLFAVIAALLALVLRKSSARIRYGIWLAASFKFLVPFSVLTAIGSRLGPKHVVVAANPGIYVIEELTQPFSQPLPQFHSAVMTATKPMTAIQWEWLLLALWSCGFFAVLFIWMTRWWRVFAARRNATSLTEGREVSTLRRLQRAAGMTAKLQLLLSPMSLEPGVFGIFRPVLLWPNSISEHLDDPHLEAVLAHELCHVQRHDNLAAALHMFIEALFWFHPGVWWLGARLIEDRERACDEAVIELGSQRHIYAESILKVCEFCLSSPLTCVSGVTGADLKKRMVQIMSNRMVSKLTLSRKLLLWTAASLAIAVPIAFGLLNATPSRAESPLPAAPKFTDVSIKPHPADNADNKGFVMTKMMILKDTDNPGFAAVGISPHMLIKTAYEIQDAQLTDEPDWVKTQKYDIAAKIDPSVVNAMRNLSDQQRNVVNQQMMRQLLADYFKLILHQQSRDLPVYELVVADSGPKLQKASGGGLVRMGIGEMDAKGAPISILIAQLSQRLGRTVVDKTGLEGNYSFSLHWTPDAEEQAHLHASGLPEFKGPSADQRAATASGPPLMSAIEEQLGLKLRPQTERLGVLVIDHIEQPE
jgi:bla regulator protein blaR1